MFVNFSNHSSADWSEEQRQAAESYGNIIDIKFPSVDPDASESDIEALADKCVESILAQKPSAVMCQGEFTLCYTVVRRLKEKGIVCLAACSVRESKEHRLDDGKVRRVSVFRFCRFREYRL